MSNGVIAKSLSLCLLLSKIAGVVAAAESHPDTAAAVAHSNAQDDRGFSIRAIAEVEVTTLNGNRETVKLAAADRVVPGDQVIYTLEIRNQGAMSLPPPRVDYAIPEHMRYLDDTAAGPGAEITYSVDGGRTFDRPENLKTTDPDGQKRTATAAEYTHIRWQLKAILKGRSVAFARFRAVVK